MHQLIWKTLNFIAKSYRAKATVKFIIFLTDLGQVKEHAAVTKDRTFFVGQKVLVSLRSWSSKRTRSCNKRQNIFCWPKSTCEFKKFDNLQRTVINATILLQES
ncbi:uncharacterized protein LOC124441681 [Xenia sp. Carnegie-2017]|uniref:uncharacterized protein LOC124441681 n=1 Tax=Xenia sp. Carnegie-2017 TaxID=2897299 RepID=UPI001F04F323|nr:uncharacterized protein LOC124441681 [Xenia sp. Carnegie-2017]